MNKLIEGILLFLMGVLLVIAGIIGYIGIFQNLLLDWFSIISLIIISFSISLIGMGTILFSTEYMIKE
jgi:hypothetical protein